MFGSKKQATPTLAPEFINQHFQLLPTDANLVNERIDELMELNYREEHNVSLISVHAYEGVMHTIFPGQSLMDKGDRNYQRALHGDVIRSFEGGFEWVLDITQNSIKYRVIDDQRKYYVDFCKRI